MNNDDEILEMINKVSDSDMTAAMFVLWNRLVTLEKKVKKLLKKK